MIQFKDFLLDYSNKGLKLYKLNNVGKEFKSTDNYYLIENLKSKEVNCLKSISDSDKEILTKLLKSKLGNLINI